MPQLADIRNCSGCLACVDTCAHGALYSRWNEEGHLTYGVVEDKCVNCHRCENSCPAINGYVYGENNLHLSRPYAAWCTDDNLRSTSTSGGAFAAIAKKVLLDGGVVIGACMIDSIVRHRSITTVGDLHLLQGSKYAQSDTSGIYKETLDYLKEGRTVVFSGLGCQIAGLMNFLPRNKMFENLFTIDLICGGVPSRALITRYLEHEAEYVQSIAGFREKSQYQFSVYNKQNEQAVIPLATRPLPLCGFYTELTNKYICYDCKDVGAHRHSDITIGDYWGDKEYTAEHKKGLSIIVVHSDKSLKMLRFCEMMLHPVKWDDFLMHNTRMVYGKNDGAKQRRRKRLAEAIKNDSYDKFVIDYANGATPKQPLYFARKLWCYMLSRILPNKRTQFVKSLLNDYNR